jgi:hypothetical protein
MLTRLGLLTGILFLALKGAGQNGSVEGYVTDASGRDTLVGAIVRLGSTIVTTSDYHGSFTLSAPAGQYTLYCTMTGAGAFQKRVTIIAGDRQRVDVHIDASTNPLDEIVISAERYQQKLSDVTSSPRLSRTRTSPRWMTRSTRYPASLYPTGRRASVAAAGFPTAQAAGF